MKLSEKAERECAEMVKEVSRRASGAFGERKQQRKDEHREPLSTCEALVLRHSHHPHFPEEETEAWGGCVLRRAPPPVTGRRRM